MSKVLLFFLHSISMLVADLGATLRATWAGLTVVAIGFALIAFMQTQASAVPADPSGVFGLLATTFLIFIGLIMIIAAWHRYVLLPPEERGEGFTASTGIVFGYLGRCIMLAIIASIISVPFALLVVNAMSGLGSSLLMELVSLPLNIALGWLLMRCSLILPACAIGQKLSVKESWGATRPFSDTIFGLTVLLAVLSLVLTLMIKVVAPPNVVGELVSMAVSLCFALVSASVLTTLYGVAIEKRSI